MPSLFIVIPVHNRRGFTRACLESLARQTTSEFTTVVVDDGSTDGTSEMIAYEFPSVIVLRGNGDLWWSGATNMGVRYALERGAQWVMTLNDDTLAAEDFVEQMKRAAQRETSALIGAVGVDADTGALVYGGEIVDWGTARFRSLLDLLPEDKRTGLHEVTHFPGRGLLVPANVFDKLGLFDARRFPQAAADYDFTHRAARAGHRVLCNYDARLLVFPGATRGAELRNDKSWRNYCEHLFGIKGAGNLRTFTIYAFRNCPKRYLPSFLFFGVLRRTFGYLKEWVLEFHGRPEGGAQC